MYKESFLLFELSTDSSSFVCFSFNADLTVISAIDFSIEIKQILLVFLSSLIHVSLFLPAIQAEPVFTELKRENEEEKGL